MICICDNCNKEFKRSPSNIKEKNFCSKECFLNYHNVNCTCLHCGKEFIRPITRSAKKYCSWDCYYQSKGFKEHSARLKRIFSKPIECICKNCGNVFMEQQARIKNGRGKYCSLSCRNIGYSKSKEHKLERSRKYNKKYREENHDWYIAQKNKRRALKYAGGGSFTKEQWIELKNKYNNKCAMCGSGGILTVDHIIPVSKWNEWILVNNVNYKCGDIENIQPLCGSCNSKKHNKII